MSTSQTLHQNAMAAMDGYVFGNDDTLRQQSLERAFDLELSALLALKEEVEPTYSILMTSLASMAWTLGRKDVVRLYALRVLSGEGPQREKDYAKELLEWVAVERPVPENMLCEKCGKRGRYGLIWGDGLWMCKFCIEYDVV